MNALTNMMAGLNTDEGEGVLPNGLPYRTMRVGTGVNNNKTRIELGGNWAERVPMVSGVSVPPTTTTVLKLLPSDETGLRVYMIVFGPDNNMHCMGHLLYQSVADDVHPVLQIDVSGDDVKRAWLDVFARV
jgi:hypothetical protein